MSWGTPVERERRNRIRLSLAAYAYEFLNIQIMTDAEFDCLAQTINREIDTGHVVLDKFFREEYSAMTGMWIHKHPELKKLEHTFVRIFKDKQQ